MTRAIGCLAILFSGLFSACVPDLEDGQFACSDGVCPEGFRCIGGRCRSGQVAPECSLNAHCDRGVQCTVAICLDGQCQYAAEDDGAYCENGLLCDGPDACQGGECVGVGPVPCDPCDETLGCAGCGSLGSMCCGGSFCGDGVSHCNQVDVCEACGGMGEACCNNGEVCSGAGCGECRAGACHPTSGTCTDCGRLGEPCCTLGACFEGVCQNNGFCEDDVLCQTVVCDVGEVCRRGSCELCGAQWGTCCADDSCDAGSTCIATLCLPCGTEGSFCCGYPTTQDCGGLECAWDAICTGACGGEFETCCAGPGGMEPTCDMGFQCAFNPGDGTAVCLPLASPETGMRR